MSSDYSERFRELAKQEGLTLPPWPSGTWPSHLYEPWNELAWRFYQLGRSDANADMNRAFGMERKPLSPECWDLFGCNPGAGTHADACPASEAVQ